MGSLRDKVAIITGGGNGIRKAIARSFSSKRARVFIADIIHEADHQVSGEIRRRQGDILALALDVTQRQSIQRMVQAVLAHDWGCCAFGTENWKTRDYQLPGIHLARAKTCPY